MSCICCLGGAACCTACACGRCLCAFFSLKAPRRAAKWMYGAIFLLIVAAAWVVRDLAVELKLPDLYTFSDCFPDVAECAGNEGVLRISFGCFAFFAIMMLSTVGTKERDDPRDSWHVGWWPVKLIALILLLLAPFFIPSAFFQVYASIAVGGSCLFLIVQLISLLNFVFVWNDSWLDNEKRHVWMIFISVACYLLSIAGIVLMYIAFAPRASCGLNIFLITFTLFLLLLLSAISIHPEVNAGPLTSGLLSLYLVFLCGSAIMSQPASESCNTRPRQEGKGEWLDIVALVIALFSIVISVYSTGIDSRCISLRPYKDEEDTTSDEVEYGYGFFHMVFALGAMYMAMLLTGWNLNQTQAKWSVDTGWISMWVKISLEWLSALLYGWIMVAPFMLKNRSFS